MLIEFSVGNYRSIKDMQTLSFLATPMNEHEDTHTFMANDKTRLLKSIGIYGANGSGKSNVIKAMWAMLNYIRATFEEKRKFDEHIQPFKLNTSTRNGGTFFQLIFMIDKKTYRYGFIYHKRKITAEWLFGTAQKNEVEYFTRENNVYNINKERFKEGVGLESKTREDNLFLNVCFDFNGEIADQIIGFFWKILLVRGNDFLTEYGLYDIMNEYLEGEIKPKVLDLIKIADADIIDINSNQNFDTEGMLKNLFNFNEPLQEINNMRDLLKNADIEKLAESAKFEGGIQNIIKNQVISKRRLFDDKLNDIGITELDFNEEASEGTKKMFNYAGLLVSVLDSGGILVIDEFDSRFHTNITKAIVKLFNSSKNKSAQFCFVTHDTNLLDKDLLRRDQIYFTEKNTRGETTLYSLSEIKGIRNDASYEKDYIKGKYGAIPFISQSNSLFE